MTTKEALSDLLFLAIGDEEHTKKCKEIIEKDLEMLDIIKFLIKKGDIAVNPDLFVDYPELYEWLEQNE